MKHARPGRQTTISFSIFRKLQHSSSGAANMEYALLLATVIAGGMVAYVGIFANKDQIFKSIACLVEMDTSTHDTSSTTETNSPHPLGTRNLALQKTTETNAATSEATLKIAGCIAIMAGIFIPCRLLLRHRPQPPKGVPSGDKLAAKPLQPGTQRQLTEKRQQIRRLFLGKIENASGFETQVRHLMSKRLTTIKPEKSIAQVKAVMEANCIRHLLVCDKEKQLIGIISDRDLSKQTEGIAKEIMTADPITVSSEMVVGPAITIMLNNGISCLPVVDHGEVTGLLTTTDLILSLQCSLQILGQITAKSNQPDMPAPLSTLPTNFEETQKSLVNDEEPSPYR